MKKALIAIVLLPFIFSACKKAETPDIHPSTVKTASRNSDSSPGCAVAAAGEGVKYYTAPNVSSSGAYASSISVDSAGNIYNTGYIVNYDYYYGIDQSDPGYASAFLRRSAPDASQVYLKELFNTGGVGYGTVEPPASFGYPTIMNDKNGNIYSLWVYINEPPFAIFTSYILTKYNSAGTKLWQITKNVGVGTPPVVMSLGTNGEIYLCSGYNAVTFFDNNPTPPFYYSLTGAGYFLQRFNSAGDSLAVTQLNTKLQNFAFGQNGDIFNSGSSYYSKIAFNGVVKWSTNTQNYGPANVAVDRNENSVLWGFSPNANAIGMGYFDASGNLRWLYKIMSPYPVGSVTFDASGNIYIIGLFQGSFDFDPGPGNYTLTAQSSSPGGQQVYIQKITPAGTLDWVKTLNVTGASSVTASTTNSTYLYITGSCGANTIYGARVSLCQ